MNEEKAQKIIKKLSKYIIVELLSELTEDERKDIKVSSFISHNDGFFPSHSAEKKLTFIIALDC